MLVCLSGSEASGKTTLARSLADFGLLYISTSDYLRQQKLALDRGQQIEAGNEQDRTTSGRWVQDLVADLAGRSLYHCVVDAVRTPDQVGWLRRLPAIVYHLHLDCPIDVLRLRRQTRDLGPNPAPDSPVPPSLYDRFDQKPMLRVADKTLNSDTEAATLLRIAGAFLLSRHR